MRARRAPTPGSTGTGAARRVEGSASVSFADACLHRGEPDGWRAPRGGPGDRVGAGRGPGRRSCVGRGAARGSGRGRHEDPEVPPRAEAGAACRLGRSGSGRWIRWLSGRLPDRIGGTPAGYSPRPPVRRWVRGASGRCSRTFARGPGLAGTGRPGTCGTRSSRCCPTMGRAIEKIARLADHASSHVTETVYRQELRPVLQEGAEVMDGLFGGVNGDPAEGMPPRTATEYAAQWICCGTFPRSRRRRPAGHGDRS